VSGWIGGGVKINAVDERPPHAVLPGQPTQRVMNLGVERFGEIAGEESIRHPGDGCLHGREQRAMSGEPDGLMGPEAVVVETGNAPERGVTAAVRVTGQITERFQFPEHGEVDVGIQSAFQLSQSGDFMALEMPLEDLRIENRWPHNVRVPSERRDHSEL
jgi:hypothetical protein